jgi:chromosomal replication initiation ATPase DnaA
MVEGESLENGIRGQSNEPRNVAIYLARKRSGLRLQEIGRQFGLTKYSSVSSVVCRTEQQLLRDRDFRVRVEGILVQLNKSQAKICPLW